LTRGRIAEGQIFEFDIGQSGAMQSAAAATLMPLTFLLHTPQQ